MVLFPGKYCNPISPRAQEMKITGRDQMQLILSLFGHKEETMRPINKDSQKVVENYMATINEFKPLNKMFGSIKIHDSFLTLLEELIVFNPQDRVSAKELLKHQIFDCIRDPANEIDAPLKIKFSLDI